jgi:hypothetical protein
MALAWPLAGVLADVHLRAAFLLYACATSILAGGALLLWDRAQRAEALSAAAAARPAS